jgi:DNA polymerase-3 subunit delta'
MDRLLTQLVPTANVQTRAAAIAAAAGSPGAALDFVQLDLGEVATIMRRILADGDIDFALRGQLAGAIGTRPDRERLQAVLDLARAALAERLDGGASDPRPVIEAHAELVRLSGEQPTYNYDAGLLAMEIGTLLANAAKASERADG